MKKKIIGLLLVIALVRIVTMTESQNESTRPYCKHCPAAAILSQAPNMAGSTSAEITNRYTEMVTVSSSIARISLTPGETKTIARPANDCRYTVYFERSGQSASQSDCSSGVVLIEE